MKTLLAFLVLIFSTTVLAQEVEYSYPKSQERVRAERSGNYLSGVAKRVPNPKIIKCNGVVDCRRKGQDLEHVFQFQGGDYSPTDYPGNCRTLDVRTGKYIFNPARCSLRGSR